MEKLSTHKLIKPSAPWIYTLFFLSSVPALIYQIVWHR